MDDTMLFAGLLIAAMLGLLVGVDANRRFGGAAGVAWGLFTFLLAIVALPCYAIAVLAKGSSSPVVRVCPQCGVTATTLTAFCAACGKRFGESQGQD